MENVAGFEMEFALRGEEGKRHHYEVDKEGVADLHSEGGSTM